MTYKYVLKDVDNTKKTLKITVSKEAVNKAFQAALEKKKTTADIRGFRKGKAPLPIVKRFLLQEITKDAANDVINDAYSYALKESKLSPTNRPSIDADKGFEENSEFCFQANIEILPQFEVKNYKDLKIKLPQDLDLKIEDELEKTIKTISRNEGSLEKAPKDSAVKKGDIVTVSYTISVNDKELVDQKAEYKKLDINDTQLPQIETALIGMKDDEVKEFDVDFPEDFQDKRLAGQKAKFSLTLHSHKNLIPRKFDEELAKKLGYASLEAAKSSIEKNLAQSIESQKMQASLNQITNYIIDKNDIQAPESLVESTIANAVARMNANLPKKLQLKANDPKISENYKADAVKSVQTMLAFKQIAQQEKLDVKQDEVNKELFDYAYQNKIDLRKLLSQADQGVYDQFAQQALTKKVISLILKSSQVEFISKDTYSALASNSSTHNEAQKEPSKESKE